MLRVLVVDDEPAIRDTVARALLRAGHAPVAVASSGARGAVLEHGAFDAVVTDAFIPARDCLDLVETLRLGPSPVPVLAISAGGAYGAAGLRPIHSCSRASLRWRARFSRSSCW